MFCKNIQKKTSIQSTSHQLSEIHRETTRHRSELPLLVKNKIEDSTNLNTLFNIGLYRKVRLSKTLMFVISIYDIYKGHIGHIGN